MILYILSALLMVGAVAAGIKAAMDMTLLP